VNNWKTRLAGLWISALVLIGAIGCQQSESVSGGLGDVRQPIQVILTDHEAKGGHTIARHVAKSEAYLIERLKKSEKLNNVSSFTKLEMAQASVNAVLNLQRQEVADWWRGDLARQAFFAQVPTHGYYLTRKDFERQGEQVKVQAVPDSAWVRVVLARKGEDYYVLTAFPQQAK